MLDKFSGKVTFVHIKLVADFKKTQQLHCNLNVNLHFISQTLLLLKFLTNIF